MLQRSEERLTLEEASFTHTHTHTHTLIYTKHTHTHTHTHAHTHTHTHTRQRIEELRLMLEEAMGFERFVAAYTYMKEVTKVK
jgi:hypothetical protein